LTTLFLYNIVNVIVNVQTFFIYKDFIMEKLLSGGNIVPKRALLKSAGFTQDDTQKPLIGIIYSHNETVSGHSDIEKFLQHIKEGIISAGAKPALATVMSICSGISMGGSQGRYLLPSRELIADSIETTVTASGFDAVVFAGSCDSTVPAMLLAAVRLNLPCIFVSPGSSQTGWFKGEKTGFSSMLEGVYAVKAGKMTATELSELENGCCPSAGSGSEMSTSNTMCCITEALGLALPFNGTATAHSAKRYSLARETGKQIVKALEEGITPKKILNLASLCNAAKLIMATGGSIDTLMHLIALANELDIDEKQFGYPLLESISAKTPSLVLPAPYSRHFIDDIDRAGGVMAVLNELNKARLLYGEAETVTGKKLKDLCKSYNIKNTEVIREFKNPFSDKGAISFLYGNLAEEGCLVRRLFVPEGKRTFSGKAKVFDCEEDALLSITSGRIFEGDCIVVRYEGPKGAPGMREMRLITSAVSGSGLENKVAIVTDGRAGGTSKGIVIAHVSPEAAEGGIIALVEDGDTIDIDIEKGKINLKVEAKILNARRKKLKPKQATVEGWLLRYSELVTGSRRGAVMKKKF
jgi:dihydroxy-acid dehydratase